MMKKLRKFIASEAVLFISMAAALISMIFVPPSKAYGDYIDLPVLIMLFCLMGVVAAFREIGVFDTVTAFLLKRTSSSRMITFILAVMCFFSSMLVTNDVALITFVPLSIDIAKKTSDRNFLIRTTVLETVAANLGSMMTPLGNPQNLFLYSHYGLSGTDFIKTLLPQGVIGFGAVSLSILMIKKQRLKADDKELAPLPVKKLTLYIMLFLVCIGAVAGLVSKYVCLGLTLAVLLIADRSVFRKIDYSLLATFVCFFVFVGNISSVEGVRSFISSVMEGREIIVSALLSQVISNVPAAVMLSGFTDNARALLAGVDIGGFGTPVASLASLISFRLYSASEGSEKGRYMVFFLIYNFAFLGFMLAVNGLLPEWK